MKTPVSILIARTMYADKVLDSDTVSFNVPYFIHSFIAARIQLVIRQDVELRWTSQFRSGAK
jgi:hypothetical protein